MRQAARARHGTVSVIQLPIHPVGGCSTASHTPAYLWEAEVEADKGPLLQDLSLRQDPFQHGVHSVSVA